MMAHGPLESDHRAFAQTPGRKTVQRDAIGETGEPSVALSLNCLTYGPHAQLHDAAGFDPGSGCAAIRPQLSRASPRDSHLVGVRFFDLSNHAGKFGERRDISLRLAPIGQLQQPYWEIDRVTA
jgi:hypothetical protein